MCSLTLQASPSAITVYCPDLELGSRKLIIDGPSKKLNLKCGRYRFVFSKPSYEVVTKDIFLKAGNTNISIELPKRKEVHDSLPLVLRVLAIFHSKRRQSAIIGYKTDYLRVDEGFVSKDGRFCIMAVDSCSIKVQSLIDGRIRTYYF